MPNNVLKPLEDLPDISFIENDTIDAMMQRMVANWEARYKKITGREVSLSDSDPMRIALYACTLELYQIEQCVNRAGKQNLLKYSYDGFLDNLAANMAVNRNEASAARTVIRFTASETKTYALAIPAETRLTNGAGVFFKTIAYAEIAPGDTYVDVEAICTDTGEKGNGYLAGQINVLVDPRPYIVTVANTATTAGGAGVESDESLRERTYLAPSSFSVAGPDGAYEYWARTYNSGIGSVKVTSPAPVEVVIYVLMTDGKLPEESVLTGLEEYLQDEKIRPLTDKVTVKAPTALNFGIDLTYYINASNSATAALIQTQVTKAVEEYVTWQTTEIGKDINPSELISRVVKAGAKRVEVTSPVFTRVGGEQVAQCTSKTVNYGGLEDD